tara:strand:- start:1039 stop:1194 length:156 start_codon:yes stop_codon:yes gene_type:complete
MKPLNIIILVLLLAFFIALLKESQWVEDMWPDIEVDWIWNVEGDRINVGIE